ncbi:hypothetical protein P4223_17780, partial [Bacillus thuringiensis]|nr:hypothetical protein [Bacillus thuringiensis]
KSFFNIAFSASNRFILASGSSGLFFGLPIPGPFVLPRFSSRPKNNPEDPEAKMKRLEAENAMLKKLLGM